MESVDLETQKGRYETRARLDSRTSKLGYAVAGLAVAARTYYLLKGVPLSTESEEGFIGVTAFGGGVGTIGHLVALSDRRNVASLEAEINPDHQTSPSSVEA
jgi:hypothetical protein